MLHTHRFTFRTAYIIVVAAISFLIKMATADKRLLVAAKAGDLDGIKLALSDGAKIETTTTDYVRLN